MKKINNILNTESGLKANPFTTPSDYFEQLPQQIQERKAVIWKDKSKNIFMALLPQLSLIIGFVVLFLFAKTLFSLIGVESDIKDELTISQNDTAAGSIRARGTSLTDKEEYIITYLVEQKISDEDIALLAE